MIIIGSLSGFGISIRVAKLCKFRPRYSFLPRRELQESIQRSESSISLRRPGWGLDETQSRLGETCSPKRDHDENLYHFERDISPRREGSGMCLVVGHMMGMELVEFPSATNGRGVLSMGLSMRLGCFTTDEEFVGQDLAKLCKFRPRYSFLPRRELQESIQRSESSISLRRPGWGLDETQSRLGETCSPKRDHDENLYHFERDISPRREVLSSERWTLSPRREWLA
ncbi:hypothetical protein DEO72_LG7g970 [Vigna unguiculata]|uniref:Uncharacterized protein n=1 Tax=Vigna unguiculata TaxID=3917 RepID=A0A4D6MI53_VIGUN|nr:hypothetical protein DEO72_LG7g970 [Vigna unguiculata]